MCKTARILIAVAFAVLLVAGSGCGRIDGRSRARVSGAVTKNGQPVKAGQVTYTPVGGGTSYTDPIYSGRYSIRSRFPLSPGKYRATVQYSCTGSSRGGYDLQHTETVTVSGTGWDYIDFRVK